ncbi:MAG TPA: hypothetical protein VG271_04265 [Beijerinckiaceae bacterium]|nr:hypothetical protein [Beijerinckiaceae bacterium]
MKRILYGAAVAAYFVMLGQSMVADMALARPIVPAERRYAPYSGQLPACDDPSVLGYIRSHFDDAQAEYWSSGLSIVGYDRVHEIGYRTNGLDYIPRRYCGAQALMNDEKRRAVAYWIGEGLGIIGTGWGVEWCVVGLDHNYAAAPNCRQELPHGAVE